MDIALLRPGAVFSVTCSQHTMHSLTLVSVATLNVQEKSRSDEHRGLA